MTKKKTKIFVLDTNVLLHNADALRSFSDNEVVIPFDVIEELDGFKKKTDETGRNARQVIRTLDALRVRGNLSEGVINEETGGVVRVSFDCRDASAIKLDNLPDNRIIATAWMLMQEGKREVQFVSKDINARIKANVLGLTAVDFEKQKINFDELYDGWKEIAVSADDLNGFFADGRLSLEGEDFFPWQGVALVDEATFLLEREGFVAHAVAVEEVSATRLRGTLLGALDPDARQLVKAATYHDLTVERAGDGWRRTPASLPPNSFCQGFR